MASSMATGKRHRAGHQLGRQRDVEVVELVVEVVDRRGRPGRALGERVRRLAPDGGGHLAHPLDEPPAAGGHLGAEAAGGPSCDVLGQITVALHVGQHAQDGDVLAALVGRGVAVDELLLHRGRHLPDQLVDDLVALHELLGRVAVAGQQGVCGSRDALADEREDLCEEAVDLVRLGHGARPQRLVDGQGSDRRRLLLGLERSGAVFVLAPSLKGIRVTLPAPHGLTTPKLASPLVTVPSQRGPPSTPLSQPTVTLARW